MYIYEITIPLHLPLARAEGNHVCIVICTFPMISAERLRFIMGVLAINVFTEEMAAPGM